jgi:alpha-tubulin suppressor-like RCC1 family protein
MLSVLALSTASTGCDQVVQIAAGRDATCARLRSGQVRCWGENPYGKLGAGDVDNDHLVPRLVARLHDAVHVAVGREHACAVRAGGAVACWGYNYERELGEGTQHNRSEPVEAHGVAGAVEVGAGGGFTCARLESGRVRCWGSNAYGLLGDGTDDARAQPVDVAGLDGATRIAVHALGGHVCAQRRVERDVVCWGASGDGELGRLENRAWAAPAPVSNPFLDAVEIVVGAAHSCARRSAGNVACWGANERGQLGDGTTDRQVEPTPVVGLADAVEVAAGAFHTCARRRAGGVVCWGANEHGQLGRAPDDRFHTRPEPVAGLDDAVELALGEAHTCARRRTGAVVCWGANEHGQLGDGTRRERAAPAAVVGLPR